MEIAFDSLCRTCAKPTVKDAVNIYSTKLVEHLSQFTSMQFVQDDVYPNIICEDCHEKVVEFKGFVKMCKKSQTRLDDLLAHKTMSKIEYPEKFEEEFISENEDCFENISAQEVSITIEPRSVDSDILAPEFETAEVDFESDAYIVQTESYDLESEIIVKSDDEHKYTDELMTEALIEEEEYDDEDNDHLNDKDYEVLEDEESESDLDMDIKSEEADEMDGDDFDEKKMLLKEESDSDTTFPTGGIKTKKFYYCKECPKKFLKEERLGNHMRIHEGLKPYPCKLCNRAYMKVTNLNAHIREVHSDSKEKVVLPCTMPDCTKVFNKKTSLQNHIRLFHYGIKAAPQKYICEICGKTVKSSWSLKDHRYTHMPEDQYPYSCERCPKKFIAVKAFKEHMMRHDNIKNFVCSVCGMKKISQRELNTHMNYHTKAKQYPCPLCPSVFNANGNLKLHNDRVHLGLKKFKCQYCDQKFSKSETLKHHEMIHTGEKPHQCTVCGKRFIQAIALKTHMKTHKTWKPPSNSINTVN